MALLIKSNENVQIETQDGAQYAQLYVHTDVSLSIQGDKLYTFPQFWLSAEAMTSGKNPVNFNPGGNYIMDYDRTRDGSDLLKAANDYAELQLEAQGYTVEVLPL